MKPDLQPTDMLINEDAIKIALLETDISDRNQGLDSLCNAFKERLMIFLKYHHAGLTPDDRGEVITRTVQRYGDLLPSNPDWLDRQIWPPLSKIALFIGKGKYRKISKQHEREIDIAVDEVAQKLESTDLGAAWHGSDSSFRRRVSEEIRKLASTLKPRQQQIASVYAQSWALGLSENESIQLIFEATGQRLTRNSYKRGWDEVRRKLQEPMVRLFREEGICLKNLK